MILRIIFPIGVWNIKLSTWKITILSTKNWFWPFFLFSRWHDHDLISTPPLWSPILWQTGLCNWSSFHYVDCQIFLSTCAWICYNTRVSLSVSFYSLFAKFCNSVSFIVLFELKSADRSSMGMGLALVYSKSNYSIVCFQLLCDANWPSLVNSAIIARVYIVLQFWVFQRWCISNLYY